MPPIQTSAVTPNSNFRSFGRPFESLRIKRPKKRDLGIHTKRIPSRELTHISHLGKRKIIFKQTLRPGDMLVATLGPQNHEKWRFYTPNIWVITTKNEGCGFPWQEGVLPKITVRSCSTSSSCSCSCSWTCSWTDSFDLFKIHRICKEKKKNTSSDAIWMFPKIGGYPQIIHFNRVFHYKPSILGYPYFWKHPYAQGIIFSTIWFDSMFLHLQQMLLEFSCEIIFCRRE